MGPCCHFQLWICLPHLRSLVSLTTASPALPWLPVTCILCVPLLLPLTIRLQGGDTPLHWLAMSGHTDGIRTLLAAPDVDAEAKDEVYKGVWELELRSLPLSF